MAEQRMKLVDGKLVPLAPRGRKADYSLIDGARKGNAKSFRVPLTITDGRPNVTPSMAKGWASKNGLTLASAGYVTDDGKSYVKIVVK